VQLYLLKFSRDFLWGCFFGCRFVLLFIPHVIYCQIASYCTVILDSLMFVFVVYLFWILLKWEISLHWDVDCFDTRMCIWLIENLCQQLITRRFTLVVWDVELLIVHIIMLHRTVPLQIFSYRIWLVMCQPLIAVFCCCSLLDTGFSSHITLSNVWILRNWSLQSGGKLCSEVILSVCIATKAW